MMRRFLSLVAMATALAACGAAARAQPNEEDREHRGAFRGRGPMQLRIQQRSARLDKQIEEDVTWLRGNGLDEYADRVNRLSEGDSPGKRVMLWRIHRLIQTLQQLRGDDARRAVENIRLDFDTARLARQVRAAQGDEQTRLRETLRGVIARHIELRIELQQAMIDADTKRFNEFHERLRKEASLERDLIEQRLLSLTNPETPLPDPLLVAVPGLDHGGPPPTEPDEGKTPDDEPPGPDRGPKPPPEELGPGDENLDQQFDRDIEWLRKRELTEIADWAAGIRDDDAPGKRLMLWQIHRWVQRMRMLKGDDARQAIEEVRLEFQIIALARECRQAEGQAQADLRDKLRDALRKQFAARQTAQRALITVMERRLERRRESLAKQQELKEQLINHRLDELADPARPLPEPELVPPIRRDPPRGETGNRPEDRPAPRSGRGQGPPAE